MYHRTPTRQRTVRRSNVSVSSRPSARAVSTRATSDGVMVPKRKSRPATNASSGGGEALQPEIAAAAIQKLQLTKYASRKNLRIDPIIILTMYQRYLADPRVLRLLCYVLARQC